MQNCNSNHPEKEKIGMGGKEIGGRLEEAFPESTIS
jgi:hypothetical protein